MGCTHSANGSTRDARDAVVATFLGYAATGDMSSATTAVAAVVAYEQKLMAKSRFVVLGRLLCFGLHHWWAVVHVVPGG